MSLAGAVPVMNLGLLRRNQITTLMDLNDQVGRLSASGLFDAVALNGGLGRPQVVENPLPQPNSVGSQVPHLDWIWEREGLGKGKGGNNAFEMSRIPQLWNWLDYGHRQKAAGAGHLVASFDLAFTPHRDLAPAPGVVLGSIPNSALTQNNANHGTAVIGIIAALHDTRGIQGVTPLADQVLGIPWPQASPSWQWQQFADISLGQLASLLIHQPAPKVINVSLGIPYYSIGNPTNTTIVPGLTYADWMDDIGELWTGCF